MKQYGKRLMHYFHIGYLGLCRLLAPPWVVKHSKVLKLDLLLQPKQLIDFIIWQYGVFEPEVIGMLKEVCPKDRPFLFLDIGSHLGQFSLFVARNYPSAQVLAFEPNPEVYQQQAINQQLNRVDYSLYPYALGQQDRMVNFYLPAKAVRDAYGALNNGVASVKKPEFKHRQLKIEQRAADKLLKPLIQKHQQVVIKLDVEGGEMPILKSLLPYLKQKRVSIVLEMLWEHHSEACEELHCILKGAGFTEIGEVEKMNRNFLYCQYTTFS